MLQAFFQPLFDLIFELHGLVSDGIQLSGPFLGSIASRPFLDDTLPLTLALTLTLTLDAS